MEFLRKITLKNMGLTQATIKTLLGPQSAVQVIDGKSVEVVTRKALTEADAPIPLAKVVGIVTRAQPGQSDNGDYLKLTGEFQGVNGHTGEMFASGVCILPNFIADALAGALAASGGNVEFALEILAKVKDNAATGYEFSVKTLTEPKSSDRMAALLHVALALPAPTAPAASEPTPPAADPTPTPPAADPTPPASDKPAAKGKGK